MSDTAPAHSIYDASIHENQVVALYDTEDAARSAQSLLLASGFPAASMQVLAREASLTDFQPAEPRMPASASEGFWGAITSLFVPEDERSTFNTVIARGHAMLVVTPDATMDRHHLIHLLEETNPVDFDAKAEEWRQAGTLIPPDIDTGYRSDPAATSTSEAARDADARYRSGQREMTEGARRVRSYIADRTPFTQPAERTIQASGTQAEPNPPQT
jgi:hypothetical protein